MQKTVILMPTYNERANAEHLIPRLFALYPDICILVIDDNSPDGTGDAIRRLMEQYPNLALLSRPKKEGLGAAYKAGMEQALKDPEIEALIIMDADGSHDPVYISELIAQGAAFDVVVGSRYIQGGGIENWERWRFLLSRFGNVYARAVMRLPVRDMTAGYVFFRARQLRKIDFKHLHASGYAFQMELKWHLIHGLQSTSTEVAIVFKARREGESKISKHIIMEGLITPWRILLQR